MVWGYSSINVRKSVYNCNEVIQLDIKGPNKLLVAFTFYNKDHLQDHHLCYHLGSRTFKVLFILNFSFLSSFLFFFSHSDLLLYDFLCIFKFWLFFYWNVFSLNWVSVMALQFLTCWWNGHWFSCAFISRPSPMEWSLISYVYIKTLFDGMVIGFHLLSYRGPLQSNGHRSFISRSSPMEWSLIS